MSDAFVTLSFVDRLFICGTITENDMRRKLEMFYVLCAYLALFSPVFNGCSAVSMIKLAWLVNVRLGMSIMLWYLLKVLWFLLSVTGQVLGMDTVWGVLLA